MRALLVLVGLVALIVAGMMALGLLTLQTKPGSLPSVSFNAGTAPVVTANVATVQMGTENKSIEVPTVTTTTKTITVPTVTMSKPAQPGNTAAPAQ